MTQKSYTLNQKIDALDQVHESETFAEASTKTGIPKTTLCRWHSKEPELREEYLKHMNVMAKHKILTAKYRLAEKILLLVESLKTEKITDAPVNQLSTAIGTLVDRFLKLQDKITEEQDGEKVFRFEYKYPDGTILDAPRWAGGNRRESGAVQSGRLWETVGQNGTRQADTDSVRSPLWQEDMVASTDIPDGESGVARLKEDDDRHNWS